MRPAIALLTALTLAACDSEGTATPDPTPGRCDAYCDQQQTCGLTPRDTCLDRCDTLTDACLTCGANTGCGQLQAGACLDECSERDAGVGDDIGEPCAVNAQCTTGWCRLETGAPQPTCARNDIGQPCTDGTTCTAGTCMANSANDDSVCAALCEDFADCPTFYTCTPGGICRRDE